MENHLKNANSQMHKELPSLDRMCQGTAFLNAGQPLPTGLEGLEAVSSRQKVLQWLEAHVPSEPETLAKEDKEWENKIDKKTSHEIVEEDITCPVPSETWEDSSESQESRDTSEEYSDQELFQSTSPSLAGPMDTEDEPATSPSRMSPQRGQAGGTTPTSTSYEQSTPSRQAPPVPGGQAGACLLPSQPLGDRSSPTAIHTPVQLQRQSLFGRMLRAVCRVFLGTHSPQEQEQQYPAPSTTQVPGDGCSKPQQGPLRE